MYLTNLRSGSILRGTFGESMTRPWTARVLTLYPEMFPGPLSHSLLGRALDEGRWRLEVRNIHPQPIYFVQSRRPYSGEQWGQDALGQTLIPSSSFIYVGMPSAGCQCAADLRITFEAERGGAGHAVEYRNIAYCSRAGESLPRLIVDN